MKSNVIVVSPQGRQLRHEMRALLTPEAREETRVEANRWIKRLRLVDYDGVPMRDRFRYRGDSLWWFTELYLHKMRRLEAAVETVLALEAVRAAESPARVTVESADDAVRLAARAFGDAHGLTVDAQGPVKSPADRAWQGYLIGLTARMSRWRPARAESVPARPAVAAFVHTAFSDAASGPGGARKENYIGPVLSALAEAAGPEQVFCVGVGPRRNFRARRWWDPLTTRDATRPTVTPIERLAPTRSLDEAMALWEQRDALAAEITAGAAIQAAGLVRGVDLWPVLQRELEAVAVVQWPWSARAMDEAGATFDRLLPQTVVTYAEAGGWGRAIILEARRRGIPTAGIQHGFIYRHWLNYLHEADEMAPGADGGMPIPDRTLVFDRYAAQHLETAGRFPADAIRVTGNARLDDLVARFAEAAGGERAAIRRALGAGAEDRVVVLAAKYAEIRRDLPDLVAASERTTGARLVIKPHPAETPQAYDAAISGAARARVAPADMDLARLLAAADGLVTMNSTVAIDALVLGVPALVVGLPNNLSPFVEAGVMLGASRAEEVGAGLEALLYDAGVRQDLVRHATTFTARFERRSDGRAAARAAAEILAMRSA
jgi:hypothetical protein